MRKYLDMFLNLFGYKVLTIDYYNEMCDELMISRYNEARAASDENDDEMFWCEDMHWIDE